MPVAMAAAALCASSCHAPGTAQDLLASGAHGSLGTPGEAPVGAGVLQGTSGPAFSGWLRLLYANSSAVDADPATAGDQDLGGFRLDSVRLIASGSVTETLSYTISMEAGDQAVLDTGNDGVALYDAYATAVLGKYAQVIVGRFSANFLWSTNIEERRLMFLDRTFTGEGTDNRDTGFELSGALDRFQWWAALQNGSDAVADKLALSGRASYRLLGEPLALQEGCCEPAGDDLQLVLGAAAFDDGNLSDGSALALDAWFVRSPFSACAEVVDWGDDLRPLPGIDADSGALIPLAADPAGAETSASLTLGYMFSPAPWEVAGRVQDLGDDADTQVFSAALNRCFAGHNAKLTLQVDTSDSDTPTLEVDTLRVGMTVGF